MTVILAFSCFNSASDRIFEQALTLPDGTQSAGIRTYRQAPLVALLGNIPSKITATLPEAVAGRAEAPWPARFQLGNGGIERAPQPRFGRRAHVPPSDVGRKELGVGAADAKDNEHPGIAKHGRADMNMEQSLAQEAHTLLAELPEETLRRLEIYAQLLHKWQRVINLVGKSSLDDLWVRHFADSLQVSAAMPEARRWLDLGSGAGFPGLVTAIKYAGEPGALVHLVEANQRKCAFLRNVIRETSAPAIVHCGRLEKILPALGEQIDAVSARALAPLEALLGHAEKFIGQGAVGVFSKGKLFEAELTDSLTVRKYLITTIASQTSSAARLVLVKRRGG